MGVIVTGVENVLRNLTQFAGHAQTARHRAAAQIAHLLANYAKGHHPWKPETGATDLSTVGFIEQETEQFALVALTATMDYDVFLELARDGRWAWLFPAVVACEQDMQRILEAELRGVKAGSLTSPLAPAGTTELFIGMNAEGAQAQE